jgi:hypothetical protein
MPSIIYRCLLVTYLCCHRVIDLQIGTPGGRPFEASTPGNSWTAPTPGASFSEAGTPTEAPQSYGTLVFDLCVLHLLQYDVCCSSIRPNWLFHCSRFIEMLFLFSSTICTDYNELFVLQLLQALICQEHPEVLRWHQVFHHTFQVLLVGSLWHLELEDWTLLLLQLVSISTTMIWTFELFILE